MTRLIAGRLAQLPIILLVIFLLTFSLAWLIPGDPLRNPEGRRPNPQVEQAMRERYRLNNPVTFAVDYLDKASGFAWLRGDHPKLFDLGPSLRFQDVTVNRILAAGLPVSVTLGLAAILLACVIGVTAGVLGGLKPGSAADTATLGVALVGISLPSFVIGAALLITFAVVLRWFPIGGWGGLRHLFLPALTLSLPFAAYIARLTRFGMIEQMRADYVRTARAKGLSWRRAAMRHALKNAFLPVLSYLGPAAAAAMTGSFVVEKVFAVPGIGQHFVDAVINKDLTLIMGIVLVYSTMLITFNLLVDILYFWVDPRIEAG
jgi:oligopeptide transport system permease protein